MAQSLRYQAVAQGGPMEVATVSRPAIEEDHEVQIQLKAVALQPLDHKQVDIGLRVQKWPCVSGMNGSGVVTDVGKGVTTVKIGDEVFGHFIPGDDRKAAFQEYAVIRDTWSGKKPASLSFEEAASLPIAYVTALGAIYSSLEIPVPYMPALPSPYRPQSTLVLGGSSSVGAAAIQLLRLWLPKLTILTTCSPAHHARMSELGANYAFDRDAPLSDIVAATPDKNGVDAILGAVEGAVDRPEILTVLRKDGDMKFAEVMSGRDTKEVPDGIKLITANGFSVWGKDGVMEGLANMLERGEFKLPLDVKVVGKGLQSIGVAMDEMRKGVSGKKLVVSL